MYWLQMIIQHTTAEEDSVTIFFLVALNFSYFKSQI